MTQPSYGRPPPDHPRRPGRPGLSAGRLWSGGVATAVVAALIVVVGVLICRGILGIELLAPGEAGDFGDGSTTGYALAAAGAALAATLLMHLLILGIPQPLQFFGWIAGLATAAAALLPLTTSAPVDAQLATGAINLVVGIAIISLLISIAGSALRPPEPPREGPPPPGY